MGTPAFSIALFAIAARRGALGQLLYRTGAENSGTNLASYISNRRNVGGMALPVAGMYCKGKRYEG